MAFLLFLKEDQLQSMNVSYQKFCFLRIYNREIAEFSPAFRLQTSDFRLPTSDFRRQTSRQNYCASDIVSCSPALVFVIGAVVAIFGIVLCCEKNKVALMRLFTI